MCQKGWLYLPLARLLPSLAVPILSIPRGAHYLEPLWLEMENYGWLTLLFCHVSSPLADVYDLLLLRVVIFLVWHHLFLTKKPNGELTSNIPCPHGRGQEDVCPRSAS